MTTALSRLAIFVFEFSKTIWKIEREWFMKARGNQIPSFVFLFLWVGGGAFDSFLGFSFKKFLGQNSGGEL